MVRAIDAASQWLDSDPWLSELWAKHWSVSSMQSGDTLRSIRRRSMLRCTAAYVNRAQCAVTHLHEWGTVCAKELVEGALCPLTFEILFQFLRDSLSASAWAYVAQHCGKPGPKAFKGTAPLVLLRDLMVAAKLFQLEVLVSLFKDDQLLTHCATEQSLKTQAEQATGAWFQVLGGLGAHGCCCGSGWLAGQV